MSGADVAANLPLYKTCSSKTTLMLAELCALFCMQAVVALHEAVTALTASFSKELRAVRDVLTAQRNDFTTLTTTSMHKLTIEHTSLKASMERQVTEYAAQKEALTHLVTQELTSLRESFSAQAAQHAAVQLDFTEQISNLKMTHAIQHDDLVAVCAALHAVCAQLEALKGTPAAVAKQVQALGWQPATAVVDKVASGGQLVDQAEFQLTTSKGHSATPKVRHSDRMVKGCSWALHKPMLAE